MDEQTVQKMVDILSTKDKLDLHKEMLNNGLIAGENSRCDEFLWVVNDNESYFVPLKSTNNYLFNNFNSFCAYFENFLNLIDEKQGSDFYIVPNPYMEDYTNTEHAYNKVDSEKLKIDLQQKIEPEGVFLNYSLKNLENKERTKDSHPFDCMLSRSLENTPLEKMANITKECHNLDLKNIFTDGYAIGEKSPEHCIWFVNDKETLCLTNYNTVETDENFTEAMYNDYIHCFSEIIENYQSNNPNSTIYIVNKPKDKLYHLDNKHNEGYISKINRAEAKTIIRETIEEKAGLDISEDFSPK